MKYRFLFLFLLALGGNSTLFAQSDDQSITAKRWNASWIKVPGEPVDGYEICLFRKTLNLANKPATYLVNVSGDNRYKLYVNGQLLSVGPARSDLYYWNYETVDLAPYLIAGKNMISAIVFNEGTLRPASQNELSNRLYFAGQHETARRRDQYGDEVEMLPQIRPITHYLGLNQIYSYYVAGPGELVDMKRQPTTMAAVWFLMIPNGNNRPPKYLQAGPKDCLRLMMAGCLYRLQFPHVN